MGKVRVGKAYLTYTKKVMADIINTFAHLVLAGQFNGFSGSFSSGSSHPTTRPSVSAG